MTKYQLAKRILEVAPNWEGFTSPEEICEQYTHKGLQTILMRLTQKNVPLSNRYWAEEAKDQMTEILCQYEDIVKEGLRKLSEDEIETVANGIAERILNDDYIWEIVNESLDRYIIAELEEYLKEGKNER